MKKNILNCIIVLTFLFTLSNTSFCQNDIAGSWIISSNFQGDDLGYVNYKMDFSENGILENPTELSSSPMGEDINFIFSAGGFMCNGVMETYVTDKYYYNPNQTQWASNAASANIGADAEMIKKLNTTDYQLLYSAEVNGSSNFILYYVNISLNNGSPIFNRYDFPNGQTEGTTSTAFAISNILDDERYIFVSAGDKTYSYSNSLGLRKYKFTPSGFVLDEILLNDSPQNDFLEKEYAAYNLEIQDKNEVDNPIIAWITSPGGIQYDQKIFVYDPVYYLNDDHYFINTSNLAGIGSGRIAGIEFSPFEDEQDYMYVSCQNLGLIKINWKTGALVQQYTALNQIDFSHSFVQTAPDGNIYVVSNNGTRFGKVDKNGSHSFDPNAFEYPETNIPGLYRRHLNYKKFGDDEVLYYTLPENDQPLLRARVTTTDNLCDIESGSAILYPLGGVPDYSLVVNWNDPYDNQNTWVDVSSLFVFNQTLEYYEAPNLMVGDYQYILTDQSACEEGWRGAFSINEGDVYDFEQNLLEINSTTAPSIYGLSDMVWDQTDNDPDDGFIINNTIMFKHGFKLSGSTTLTINNLRLEFDEDYMAKVIIEPGSKLILNNCTLTNYHCSDPSAKWAGIEVWGNKNESQTEANQGKLVMNNSTIEHAHEAVQLWKPGDYYKTGGMVYAQNSEFKNNRRAISFLSYIYSHPQFGIEYNYYSQLNQCVFLNDEDYLDDNPFYAFITMWDVKGVNIKVCTFDAGSQNGNGINTIDAGFTLSGNCNNSMGCAPAEWERCEFYNFDKAIWARNTSFLTTYPINIQHSFFLNNNYGAYLDNLHHVANVNTSEFVVGNNGETKEKLLCGSFFGRGTHIQASNGFSIENNLFSKNTGADLDDDVIGILALDNPSTHDIIFNNEFTGLKIGNWAVKTNREAPNDDQFGLEYQCNKNSNNIIDFDVSGTTPQQDQIYTYMGFTNISAHNTYSNASSPGFEWHWKNIGIQSIQYFYDNILEGPMYLPTAIKTYNDDDNLFVVHRYANILNECPDGSGIHIEKTTLSPEEKQALETEFATAYQNYEAVETIYEDLKDGGSTEGTSLTIASAQPTDTWELHDNLLGKSPHLSREILEEASNRTDVLPNSVLLDILAANPDELKKEDFIQYLENKEDPLPNYMINILKDVSAGTTYKTALLNEMNEHQTVKTRTAKRMIKALMNEEEQDFTAIKNWLSNLGGMQSDLQIAGILINEGNNMDANALLNMIPDLYNLQGDALDLYLDDKYMMNLEMDLKQEGRNIAQLNSSEIAQLEAIADNESGSARAATRTILETFYGYNNYCDCLNHGENKSTNASSAFTKEESPLSIEASPNPATHYVEFTYQLSEIDKDGLIIITDMNGKQIQIFPTKYQNGKQALDTRNIPSGSYIFTLKTKYFEKSGKLIIQ